MNREYFLYMHNLYIYKYTHAAVYLSVQLCIHPSLHPSIHPSSASVVLSLCLPASLSLCLSLTILSLNPRKLRVGFVSIGVGLALLCLAAFWLEASFMAISCIQWQRFGSPPPFWFKGSFRVGSLRRGESTERTYKAYKGGGSLRSYTRQIGFTYGPASVGHFL